LKLELTHGTVDLPAFFPDGTRAVVRCVDSRDLVEAGVPGLVINTYHLLRSPGKSTIQALGGLHRFMNWDKPILTDSGGFQAYSLVSQNPKRGAVEDDGIVFRPDGGGEAVKLTPESCIRAQFAYGSDMMMCLDECTALDAPRGECERSVERTTRWAAACRREYERQLAIRRIGSQNRSKLLAIIQGGGYPDLRRQCADALKAIGFDGYGFGGWPLDSSGELDKDTLALTASLMPDDSPKYAMGLGMPESIAACVRMGYNLFDCVIPTREARHNRLYIYNEQFKTTDDIDLGKPGFTARFYPLDEKHWRDKRPLSSVCDCLCCRTCSRAYLSHLYRIRDPLAYRLGTIHNLRFYTMLMERIRVIYGHE